MRDLFFKDFGWKIFSLFLALAIWLTVHRILLETPEPVTPVGTSSLTYGNLPILVVATASDVHLYRVAPDTVSVTVRGVPDVIAVLQANQIRASVDLTGFNPAGDLKQRVNISVPPGIALVNVEPQKVGVIIPPSPTKNQ